MRVGDLVITRKGNLAVITAMESCGIYIDLFFPKTGHHRTGFHCSKIRGLARHYK